MIDLAPELIEAFRSAARILFFTGAGVSAESGLPTFRDAQSGLWAKYRPQDLATPEAFARDPEMVWRWYQWRRRVHSGVAPNAAHRAIAAIQQRMPGVVLVTQNVDRLHESAGSPDVIHLHGTLFRNRCSACGRGMPEFSFALESPPLCEACGGLCRPDIVWFGEGLPKPAWEAAVRATEAAEIVVSIGTSAMVYPAAELPRMAQRSGALVVQVNPEATPLDAIAHNLRGTAATVLPTLAEAVWG